MTVHFIGAGPGDPELITVRGLRLIESCPVCLYAGSLVPEAVVAAAPADARVIDTASLTLDDIIDEIVAAHDKGQDVARVGLTRDRIERSGRERAGAGIHRAPVFLRLLSRGRAVPKARFERGNVLPHRG